VSAAPDRRTDRWPWEDLELIYLESGFFLLRSSDRATSVRTKKLESAAAQDLVKVMSLDGQRTEHRLSNLALIAPSPVRSTAKPLGLVARV
jgi:hypothetical protein